MLNVNEKEQNAMTKEEYVAPELEIIEFETEDVIITSCDANNETELGH